MSVYLAAELLDRHPSGREGEVPIELELQRSGDGKEVVPRR